ncbi:N-acetyltransferase domain-containing protein [Mycena sanguinolenta]|uniref:N-acetyltransferase domain-containing protein n=1 Tax=Mycena sanguinolenta TaxID=230812 RepID=A0A8H6XG26_9AGAR|nr:N-acetyltransferase domain-containing protein [Mycena sanguinolenta]
MGAEEVSRLTPPNGTSQVEVTKKSNVGISSLFSTYAMSESVAVHIRVATVADLDELAAMNQRAFISSPPQTYFSGANAPLTMDSKDEKRRNNQTRFLKFLIRRSWSLGARITVAVIPGGENGADRIVGATIWRPPITGENKSPSMLSALRMGLFSVLVSWGISAMTRISDLVQSSEHVLEDGYASRNLPGTPEDSWYLQLAGVDPDFQGKGYMSMLLQEAFKHAPDATFTLEATTPRSRDVYKHYAFEVVREVVVGKGKVDGLGVNASGDAATGFPIYPMIKVP